MARIDLHAHYYPEVFSTAIEPCATIRFRSFHDADLTTRLPDLDAGGVRRQVISAGAFMPYHADEQIAESVADAANDVYGSAVERAGERFAAFGSLPLPHVDASIRTAERLGADGRFVGIALGSGADGVPIDAERFEALWAALDAQSATVYLHPGIYNGPILGEGDFPGFFLDPAFGSPSETARCVARLALAGIPLRFPRVRIVVANWGGMLPSGWPHFSRALPESERETVLDNLRAMWFDTGTMTSAALLAVRASYGIHRLAFGSDYPYGTIADTVALLERDLTPDECVQVLDHGSEHALGD